MRSEKAARRRAISQLLSRLSGEGRGNVTQRAGQREKGCCRNPSIIVLQYCPAGARQCGLRSSSVTGRLLASVSGMRGEFGQAKGGFRNLRQVLIPGSDPQLTFLYIGETGVRSERSKPFRLNSV